SPYLGLSREGPRSGPLRSDLLLPSCIGLRSPEQPYEVLLPGRWRCYVRRQLQFEADEVAKPGLGSTRQCQPIGEEQGIPLPQDLAGQEQVDASMRRLGGRHDFKSTPGVRNAGDLVSITK